jgi:hypothetical protein
MVIFYAIYFLFASPTFKSLTQNEADPETPETEVVQSEQEFQVDSSIVYFDWIAQSNPYNLDLPPPSGEEYYQPPDLVKILKNHLWYQFNRPPPAFS